MYCRKCGCELNEGARFCKKCGTAVRDAQQEAAAPAPAENAAPAPPPAPAAGSAPAGKPAAAARPARAKKSSSASGADKIDFKLIAAVAVFLAVQLAVAVKVVSSVDAPPAAAPGVQATVPADGTSGDSTAASYFGKDIRVGGKVEFGSYEQDGVTSNGKEPIMWDVVASYEDGYLLVSRYILDGMPWDDGSEQESVLELKTDITYEKCSMRRWIRDSFAAEAFTEEERAMILPVSVDGDDVLAKKNNSYATDYAFILREDEVMDYWGYAATDVANAAIACAPTEYATWSGLVSDTAGNARYSYGNNTSAASPWALRRRYTDERAKEAKIVTVDTKGRFSNAFVSEILGFRPAIYIAY